jgi:uncharacterized protein with HEPN domain
MPRPYGDIRLRHMLDHAREASAMAKGRGRAELDTDRQLNLSLVRLLEIVGEAASRVPAEQRSLYPDIPWPEIVGLRNRLIHGNDSVDFDILWQIVSKTGSVDGPAPSTLPLHFLPLDGGLPFTGRQ